MLCHVSLPDFVITEFKLREKARGQELLQAVCKRLGIMEVDYFGLQFTGPKNEILWLNSRNRIRRQIPGASPYRLQFRVKFFVQPQYLLQDATRHQFFLDLKKNLEEGKITPEPEKAATVYALIAQATVGDHGDSYLPCDFCQGTEVESQWTSDFRGRVSVEHANLKGVRSAAAKQFFIKELSSMENYGIEYHLAKSESGNSLHIGVGSEEIKIYDDEFNLVERFAYSGLKMATHVKNNLYLRITTPDGETMFTFRLLTQEAACALYRSITEYHAFYRCDTVRNAVTDQFTRDLRETLISFFGDEDSEKKYIFDVQRTSREVYDHWRRVLYKRGCDPIQNNNATVRFKEAETCDSHAAQLQEQLTKMEDSFKCKICMDHQIDTVFCPCGHMVSCSVCATNVKSCPICRRNIDRTQHVFFPVVVGKT
ncbi:E3 ubiquitin-protein ligase MYLIP-like [Montipora foliosa]|uniref:E3 ubiquitin-protein ligase MYLIP-like n=1 Tax=Montipora foliosa TaxID=591990 RepID=UPI0035F1FDFD